MKRTLGLLAAALVFLIIGIGHTSAAQTPKFKLTLSPIYENETLNPGSDNNGDLYIINQGQDPIYYSVYATPYGVSDEHYTPDFKPIKGRPNISSWFHFIDPGKIILPGQTNTIRYTLDLPKNVLPGGYYGAIFVRSSDSPSAPKQSGVQINQSLGEIFYIDVPGNVLKSSKLVSWSAASLQSNNVTASVRLENAGSIHYFASVKVNFHSIFGGSNASETLSKVVLPQTIRDIPVNLPNPPSFALYRVSGSIQAYKKIGLGNRYILVVSRSTRVKALIAVGLVILVILLDISFSSIIQYVRKVWGKIRK